MAAEPTPAAPAPPTEERRLSLKPLFDFAAAGAGLVVLIQLVGRAVVWARFDAIGLPATQAVSLQPLEVLLANGAAALGVAFGLGFAAVAALVAIDSLLATRGVERHGRVVLLVVLELILVVAVLQQPASWSQRAVSLGAGLAAGIAFWVLSEKAHRRQVVLATFLLIAAVGGVLAFVRNSGPPARFPMATVFLKDGSLTTGAYVALNSDTVYLAPDSFNRTYGQLAAIPRAEVKRISLSPPQEFEEAGVSSPRALLAGRRVKPPYGSVAPAIARYLASQAGDPVWQYPPVSFLESAYYMSRHPGMFFGNDPAPDVPAGRDLPLAQLVRGAREYSGQPVRTEGIVLRTSQVPGGADLPTARLLTLRDKDDPHALALCLHVGMDEVPTGRKVSAVGVVVNAGTVASDEPTPIKGVFLQTAGNRCGI
jgi:hypothetical protein